MISLADRVLQTSTTGGTVTLQLEAAPTGFRGFVAAVGSGKKVLYHIDDGTSWESGIGTVTTGTPKDLLSRDNVRASSNNGALVNFGTNSKNVRLVLISDVTIIRDENLNLVEGYAAGAGTANAHTLTLTPAPLAYSDGMTVRYFAPAANTGAATINVNALGAKAIKVNGQDPGAGVMPSGWPVQLIYKSASGWFELLNPYRVGSVSAKTASFSIAATESGTVFTADATSGAITVSPAAASNGFEFTVKKIDNSANAVTIDFNGAETGDGATTIVLTNQYDAVTVRSNGTSWVIVSRVSTPIFSKYVQTADQTFAAGGTGNAAHGLPSAPTMYQPWLKCVSAELGYSAGDITPLNDHMHFVAAGTGYGISSVPNNTNIVWRIGSGGFYLMNKGTGGSAIITPSNWVLFYRAWL
ncbi:hypothetical protein [Methylobacterium oryzae]|uniref:hypothetical protein n=1 Tax=Methylobacterium oryzae TaxID=334852 RepID=UPI002F3589E8